jgi:molybdopterin molybdotransferase
MPEFLRLLPPDEARELFLSNIPMRAPAVENVDTSTAFGRVTAGDIFALHALPEFRKSTVDGYAVWAKDSFGATAAQPAYLRLAGEVPMGATPAQDIDAGQCVLIHTGGMLPASADAVVMLENAQRVGTIQANDPAQRRQGNAGALQLEWDEIEVLRPVATGENVIQIGEDVVQGQIILSRGIRLRAAQIGGLMALGITSVPVVKQPRVGLVSSGDEIVEPHVQPSPGQIRDVNAYSLGALVSEMGGVPVTCGIVPDDPDRVETAARQALAEYDVVVISAGSSASTRDLTAQAISTLGVPGVLVHGINIRPGKPTILGVCDGKGVIGLPGNPVSALVIGRLFVAPLVEALLGLQPESPRPKVAARLSVNLPSQAGREDWWPVKLQFSERTNSKWDAVPIFGRSNLIFNLASADGLLRIPPEKNGLSVGELVQIEPI